MTFAHLGLGIGNGQAFSQLLGLGMKKSIPNFLIGKSKEKSNFHLFGLGLGMKKLSKPYLGKKCQKSIGKDGNGNFHSCLPHWYSTTSENTNFFRMKDWQ